jgi:HEAT repeat protein
MTDPTDPSPADRILARLEADDPETATARAEGLASVPAEERKAALRALRSTAGDRPALVAPLCPAVASFLDDGERSVRLTAAKLLVVVAAGRPGAVLPVVPVLADCLADEAEFYYVRARAAEALGYVALERPDAVGSPETLAELRVGLSFDEPEVREKLAKALEGVSLGNPDRLRHQVSSLGEHLDDGQTLVRYHLCTALVAIGCEHPERLASVRAALVERLDDDSPQVRGRAAEALGLLARETPDAPFPEEALRRLTDDEPFVAERARFALATAEERGASENHPAGVGTVTGVRETTEGAVEAITSPDDAACPHCGLALPEDGPPMCPRCGGPY